MGADRSLIAYLYRRAGFGAKPPQLDRGAQVGYKATVQELVNGLTGPDPTGTRPPTLTSFTELQKGRGSSYEQFGALLSWWVERMATTSTPLREKLTLLLHNQFPTAFDKVGTPIVMYHQNEIFRTGGHVPFDQLTQQLSKDPAMLIWLDTESNLKQAPNENFARELMERFTMGIGHYTEEDVRQSARAFTGWSMSWKTGKFEFNAYDHDYGEKYFLGRRGDLTGEDVISIVTNSPASHRWIASRFWSWLAFPIGPNHPIAGQLAASYAPGLNLANLLHAILLHPEFTSPAARNGLVKQPIEWVAGIFRAFNLRAANFHKAGGTDFLHWTMDGLGQTPFNPPNVGGWGQNGYWLSTVSSLAQLNFTQSVVDVADISAVEDEAPSSARPEALANLLGIDGWSNQSHAALAHVQHTSPVLVSLGLTAPEYLVN